MTRSQREKRPLFIIKSGTMSARDIRRAERLSGVVVVECDSPEEARFLDPPLDADVGLQARCALKVIRHIHEQTSNSSVTFYGSMLIRRFMGALLDASPEAVTKVSAVKR